MMTPHWGRDSSTPLKLDARDDSTRMKVVEDDELAKFAGCRTCSPSSLMKAWCRGGRLEEIWRVLRPQIDLKMASLKTIHLKVARLRCCHGHCIENAKRVSIERSVWKSENAENDGFRSMGIWGKCKLDLHGQARHCSAITCATSKEKHCLLLCA